MEKLSTPTSNNTARLNAILDSDDGARYIGEFALGFNPYIQEPMRDILFDEKIAGSFISRPGKRTKEPITAIAVRFIGTWSASSGRITVAARSISTKCSSERWPLRPEGTSSAQSGKPEIPVNRIQSELGALG